MRTVNASIADAPERGVIVGEPVGVRIKSKGAELAVRDFGGEGEAIMLLHGGPGVPDYLAPVADMLGPRYRAITFDQRGVGSSVVSQPGSGHYSWAVAASSCLGAGGRYVCRSGGPAGPTVGAGTSSIPRDCSSG